MKRALAWFCCWLWALGILQAHQASDGYVLLSVTNQTLSGRIDLAIRDLDAVLGLDDNADGTITWGEVKNHSDELAQYVRTNLAVYINRQSNAVPIGTLELLVDEHAGAEFGVWRFHLDGLPKLESLILKYGCIFEVDALHRAFVKAEYQGKVQTAMMSPFHLVHEFDFATPPPTLTLGGFVREGVWHIWTGYDHVLFLLALLLPAVLQRRDSRWEAVDRLQVALWRVLKTVTAFTVAHSITLTLAALGWVNLSPRIVEPIIAASVALAAINNLRPFFLERGWMVAFGFGLIHGFGFASVLQEMDLTGRSLIGPLLGFNLGVELGQAAIVIVFVPIAFGCRHTAGYRIGALRFGSAAIAILAGIWMVERLLGA